MDAFLGPVDENKLLECGLQSGVFSSILPDI